MMTTCRWWRTALSGVVLFAIAPSGRAACPELSAPISYASKQLPRHMVSGDFNGDGIVDLASGVSNPGPSIAVWLGGANGRW